MRWFRLATTVAVVVVIGLIGVMVVHVWRGQLSEAERHFSRGAALWDEGRTQEAIEEYNKGIEADPSYEGNYAGLGRVYNDAGEHQQALDVLNKGFEEVSGADDDALAGLYNVRANAHRGLGNFEQAMADLDKAIELSDDHHTAYYNRGLLYQEMGDLEQAVADYDRCIELAPEDMLPYMRRASAYEDLGRTDQAIADLEKALSLTDNANEIAGIEAIIERLLGQ